MTVEQFELRLPLALHGALRTMADRERRSLRAEIVYLLEQAVRQHAANRDQRSTQRVRERGHVRRAKVRLPLELRSALDTLAEREWRSVQPEVLYLLEQAVERDEANRSEQ